MSGVGNNAAIHIDEQTIEMLDVDIVWDQLENTEQIAAGSSTLLLTAIQEEGGSIEKRYVQSPEAQNLTLWAYTNLFI
jgi:hypothetical protein